MDKLDLNLLRVFEALYEERMVSRAAARLGLTQSAVSHALGRLREALDDPLFIRGAQGFSPTSRAEKLARPVGEALSVLRHAFTPEGFDPAVSTREFRIAAGAMIVEFLLPSVVAGLCSRASQTCLSIWNLTGELAAWLDAGLIDLAIGGVGNSSKRFMSEPLFDEVLVWVARTGHPQAHRVQTPEELAQLPRIAIRAGDRRIDAQGVWSEGGIDRRGTTEAGPLLVSEFGMTVRTAAVTVYDSRSALAIVEQSDLVALVPLHLTAANLERFDVRPLKKLPPMRTATISMLWHRSRSEDAGHRWMRELLTDAVGAFGARLA